MILMSLKMAERKTPFTSETFLNEYDYIVGKYCFGAFSWLRSTREASELNPIYYMCTQSAQKQIPMCELKNQAEPNKWSGSNRLHIYISTLSQIGYLFGTHHHRLIKPHLSLY